MTVRIPTKAPQDQLAAMADGLPHEATRGQCVRIWDTSTGAWHDPFAGWTVSWGARWSPDGVALAAFVFRPGGPPRLAVWNAHEMRARSLAPATAPFFTFSRPQWALGGRAIVCPTPVPALDQPAADDPQDWRGVRVLRSPNTPDTTAPLEHANLALVDLAGSVRTLASGWTVRGWRVSPAGNTVGCLRVERYATADHELYYALEVIDLLDGAVTTLAHGVCQQYGLEWSWSPDGRHLAYLHRPRRLPGSCWVVAADGATPPFRLADPGEATHTVNGSDQSDPYDAPRWLSPDVLICRRETGYTRWNLAGAAAHEIPAEEAGRGAWLQRFDDGRLATFGDERELGLVNHEDRTFTLTAIPVDGGPAESLGRYPGTVATGQLTLGASGCGRPGILLVEPPGGTWEIWLADATGARPFAALNPKVAAPHVSRRITIGHGASDLQAALFVPATPPPPSGYPLVVAVYGGARQAELADAFDPEQGMVATSMLTARGVAVLYPDLPITDIDPMRQFAPILTEAFTRLRAEPVYLDRVSIIGHSYGSYTALSLLVTMPDAFRSAVLTAPFVNPFASYGTLGPTGATTDGIWESGQGRLGGPPWSRTQAYVDNTPYLYLDRVKASVLIATGTQGLPGETAQAEQLFSGLRRLGRTTELRIYDGEGHTPTGWSPAAYRDFAEHALEWLCGPPHVDPRRSRGNVSSPSRPH